MNFATPHRMLRPLLWLDAASAGGCGALQLAAAGMLAPLFGLSSTLLLASGAALLAYVAAASWLASRETVPRAGVQALALANAAWVVGCLALLLTGQAGTTWGQAWLVLQAVAVGVLAELQWMAVRRSHPVAVA
jgi:hypothetical protein